MTERLGHIANAQFGHFFRGEIRHFLTICKYPARAGGYIAHQGANQGGLAHAVTPQQAYGLALRQRQRDAVQDMAVAIKTVHIL